MDGGDCAASHPTRGEDEFGQQSWRTRQHAKGVGRDKGRCATLPSFGSEALLEPALLPSGDEGAELLWLPPPPVKLLDGAELDYIEAFLNSLAAPDAGTPSPGGGSGSGGLVAERLSLAMPAEEEESERKSRHVVAEHRRKEKIRGELDRLAQLVPALGDAGGGRRTQAKVIAAASRYILDLQRENEALRALLIRHHRGTGGGEK